MAGGGDTVCLVAPVCPFTRHSRCQMPRELRVLRDPRMWEFSEAQASPR